MSLFPLFRELSEEEAARFRAWARANYEPFKDIDDMWHPVVREECETMNAERLEEVKAKLTERKENGI